MAAGGAAVAAAAAVKMQLHAEPEDKCVSASGRHPPLSPALAPELVSLGAKRMCLSLEMQSAVLIPPYIVNC